MKKNGFTRILLVLLTGVSLFCLLPCAALAADTDALYNESGIEDAFDVLDEQTLSLLESLGLDISDPASLLDITPARVVSAALSLFTGGLTELMQKCAIIMGAVLLFALLDSAAPSVGKSSDTGGMLLMLMLSLLVIAPVSDCVSNVLSAIRVLSGFTRMLILCGSVRKTAALRFVFRGVFGGGGSGFVGGGYLFCAPCGCVCCHLRGGGGESRI